MAATRGLTRGLLVLALVSAAAASSLCPDTSKMTLSSPQFSPMATDMAIAPDGGIVLASPQALMYSINGFEYGSWQHYTPGALAVCWSNDWSAFVAMSQEPAGIMISSNGTNWQRVPNMPNIRGFTPSGIACAGPAVILSVQLDPFTASPAVYRITVDSAGNYTWQPNSKVPLPFPDTGIPFTVQHVAALKSTVLFQLSVRAQVPKLQFYFSSDFGASWQFMNSTIPRVAASVMAVNEQDFVVMAYSPAKNNVMRYRVTKGVWSAGTPAAGGAGSSSYFYLGVGDGDVSHPTLLGAMQYGTKPTVATSVDLGMTWQPITISPDVNPSWLANSLKYESGMYMCILGGSPAPSSSLKDFYMISPNSVTWTSAGNAIAADLTTFATDSSGEQGLQITPFNQGYGVVPTLVTFSDDGVTATNDVPSINLGDVKATAYSPGFGSFYAVTESGFYDTSFTVYRGDGKNGDLGHRWLPVGVHATTLTPQGPPVIAAVNNTLTVIMVLQSTKPIPGPMAPPELALLTSHDGLNFESDTQALPLGTYSTVGIYDVACTASSCILLGGIAPDSGPNSNLWWQLVRSTTQDEWRQGGLNGTVTHNNEQQSFAMTTSDSTFYVLLGPGTYHTPSAPSYLLMSADGITWQPSRTVPGVHGLSSAAYTIPFTFLKPGMLLVGYEGNVLVSENEGVSWETCDATPFGGQVSGITPLAPHATLITADGTIGMPLIYKATFGL